MTAMAIADLVFELPQEWAQISPQDLPGIVVDAEDPIAPEEADLEIFLQILSDAFERHEAITAALGVFRHPSSSGPPAVRAAAFLVGTAAPDDVPVHAIEMEHGHLGPGHCWTGCEVHGTSAGASVEVHTVDYWFPQAGVRVRGLSPARLGGPRYAVLLDAMCESLTPSRAPA